VPLKGHRQSPQCRHKKGAVAARLESTGDLDPGCPQPGLILGVDAGGVEKIAHRPIVCSGHPRSERNTNLPVVGEQGGKSKTEEVNALGREIRERYWPCNTRSWFPGWVANITAEPCPNQTVCLHAGRVLRLRLKEIRLGGEGEWECFGRRVLLAGNIGASPEKTSPAPVHKCRRREENAGDKREETT